MPIPALSTSYKHRGHVSKGNNEKPSQLVITNRSNPHAAIDMPQSVEEAVQENDTRESTAVKPQSSMRPPLSLPSSGVEGAKRRSLLPQPGHTRHSSRLVDNASARPDARLEDTATGRVRPRSMYQIANTPLEQAETEDETTASQSMRPPTSISKPTETQTAGLARSRSLRKPGVSFESSQSTIHPVHSRTQSSSNASILRREAINAKTSNERPRSFLMAPTSTLKSNNVPADLVSTNSRSSARLAGLSRTVSVKTKPESLSGAVGTRTAPRPEDPVETQPRRREVLKGETRNTAKPAFTTLQQHFTPRKISKAPTSTFLHPAPAPGSNPLPPEIVSLQSELLQLHLLHETSAQVEQRWQLSAKRNLHKKFEEVKSLHQAVLDYERAGQEQKNLQALFEWSIGAPSEGLINHIQILSGPLHELPSLVEPGGRFQRLVCDFEHWMRWVEELRSVRRGSNEGEGDLGSIEGLTDSWKAEAAALIRKVASFTRDLDLLAQPSAGSSIACIIDTCMALLKGLLDELHTMQSIEAEVVSKEKEWVEDRLQAIARDVSSYLVNPDGETLSWRR